MRAVKRWFGMQPIDRVLVLDALRKATSSLDDDRRAARTQLREWRLPTALDSVIVEELSAYVRLKRPRSPVCRSFQSPASVADSGAISADLQDVIELAGTLAHRDRRTFAQRLRGVPPSPHLTVRLSRVDLRRIDRVPLDPRAEVVSSLDLRGAQLDSACLADARLHYALLDSANLRGADLTGADLTSSSMVGTKLSLAKMPNANLTFANLRCAKLGAVDLSDADFSKASLEWAFLGGATLKGVKNWSEVRGFDSTFLAHAVELSESDRAWAAAKGAIIAPRDQLAWTTQATARLLPDSICVRPPLAADSADTR